MRELGLVNQLWVIVPLNVRKNRTSSELLYKSNRSQVSMGYLQCNELNRGHPTFFVAPFSKYLVAFSLMEMNFSPQVTHLRLVRYERTLILLF